MSVPSQNIPIQFGGGIDTKTDPKAVQAGKLLRLQDAIQVSSKQWRKRNGNKPLPTAVVGGGNITSPKLVASFKNELVCADSALGQLLSYSPTQGAWVPKGNYVPVQVSNNVVSRYYATTTASGGHLGTNGAAIGNIAVFCWLTRAPTFVTPMASVIDLQTGTAISSDYIFPVSASCQTAQAVLLAGNTLAIIWSSSTSGSIYMSKLTVSGATVSWGSPITLLTDTVQGVVVAAGTSTGGVLAYQTTSTHIVKLVTFNTAGSIVNSASVASIGAGGSYLTINSEPSTNNVWVYWQDINSLTISYAVYSSTLSVVLAATAITTASNGAQKMVPVPVATGQQKLIYGVFVTSVSNQDTLYTTYSVQVQSNGVTTLPSVFAENVIPYSSYFTINGVQYLLCNYVSYTQGTFFALKVSDGSVLAKCLPGSAEPYVVGWVSTPIQITATKVLIPVAQAYASEVIPPNLIRITGTNFLTLDAGSSEVYQALEANNNLVLNGGQIFGYDGRLISEIGFHLFPLISSTSQGGGGSMADGNYQYFATYRYTDDQGNIYESEPSVAANVTVSAGGGTASVTVNVSSIAMTAKQSANGAIELCLYRTTAGGTTANLVKVALNSTTSSTIAISDTLNDTSLTNGTPIYTSGSSGELGNQSPPAAVALALHNNRLWLISSERPNEVWYSKTFTETAGINFSGDLLVEVDAVGGNLIALAGMDDKLVLFANRQPLVIYGDGANPVGAGSTLSNPQPIPSDAGCITSKSVIVFSDGALRKTNKGFYLLGRNLQDSYYGIQAEGFNSQDVQAVTRVAGYSHIRMLTSFGLSLNYDYIFQQWGVFTNYQGYSACNWNNTYVYARTDGAIYQESPGYYLDNVTSYAPLIRLPWLAFAGIQGFQRVREFLMLGDYANGGGITHGVQVSAAYDFVESFSTPVPFAFSNSPSSGPFQYREGLARQKCDAVSLLIQEITTGDSAEYISFTDMSFEAGVKRGLNKLPKTRSVG